MKMRTTTVNLALYICADTLYVSWNTSFTFAVFRGGDAVGFPKSPGEVALIGKTQGIAYFADARCGVPQQRFTFR